MTIRPSSSTAATHTAPTCRTTSRTLSPPPGIATVSVTRVMMRPSYAVSLARTSYSPGRAGSTIVRSRPARSRGPRPPSDPDLLVLVQRHGQPRGLGEVDRRLHERREQRGGPGRAALELRRGLGADEERVDLAGQLGELDEQAVGRGAREDQPGLADLVP